MHHTCHHCDYDLMGLPDRGQCPECGQSYNKNSPARSAYARTTPAERHFKWVALATISVLALLGGGALSLSPGTFSWTGLIFTLAFSALSGFGAFTYWNQARNEKREAQ